MLEFRQLRKSYGTVTALQGVSFDVGDGEVVGFVGANGAGKSTAMRIAMGVLAADDGDVRWNGRPIGFGTRRQFGYMPEQRGLYPKMRIAEQVAYLGQLRGMSASDAQAAAHRWLKRLQVAAEPDALLQNLSLGNQQRVQLAAALVHEPGLLILDEPFSGLDPIGVDTMSEVLRERAAAGVAVLFSSHQLELVEQLCQRVTIITGGRLVATGTLAQLRAQAGRALLEVHLAPSTPDGASPGSGGGWLSGTGAQVESAQPVDDGPPGTIGYALRLEDPQQDQAVLAAAARAGRVLHFGWQRLPLAQLYRDAVAAP